MIYSTEAAEAARPRRPGLLATPRRALASSALYRMLALAFSNPEPELVRSVIRACGELKIAGSRGALTVRVGQAQKAMEREWRAVSAEQLQDEYSRLFLGAGLVPLREGGFGDGLRFAGQPVDIADISGFYLAFGFALPPHAANPPDHLGAELEFLSLLHLKLALALKRGRTEHIQTTRRAMAHFLADHLGRWAGSLAAALEEASALPVYQATGRLLARAVEADCESLKVRPLKAGAGSGKDPVGSDELVCPLANQRSGGTGFGAGGLRDASGGQT